MFPFWTGYSYIPWFGTAYAFHKQLLGLLNVVWKPEDILPREISPRHLRRQQINVEPYLEDADENSYLFFLIIFHHSFDHINNFIIICDRIKLIVIICLLGITKMVQRLFADVLDDAIWFMNIHAQNHPRFLAMWNNGN
jgi:hypothetical protein